MLVTSKHFITRVKETSTDQSETEKSDDELSDDVTEVFPVKNDTTDHKTTAFKIGFELTICPLVRSLGAEGIIMLIIHIN